MCGNHQSAHVIHRAHRQEKKRSSIGVSDVQYSTADVSSMKTGNYSPQVSYCIIRAATAALGAFWLLFHSTLLSRCSFEYLTQTRRVKRQKVMNYTLAVPRLCATGVCLPQSSETKRVGLLTSRVVLGDEKKNKSSFHYWTTSVV